MSATSGFGGGGSVVNGILTLTGNLNGPVGPDGAQNIDTLGGTLIQVVGVPASNELTWNLVGGTEGQVIVTNTAGTPQWRTLFSSNGTVTINYDPVSESLDFTANAGAIDVSQLDPEVGGAVFPSMGAIEIYGALAPYKNITTYNGGGNRLEVRLNDAINWPETTSLTSGTISFDGNQFLHAYGAGGLADNNTFLGNLAGNFTMGVSADENTALGSSCLSQITTASENLAAGAFALRLLTTGEFNVAAGLGAGENITTGSYNTLLGHSAGSNYVLDESSNILIGTAVSGVAGEDNTIRIGTDGVGLGQQNAFYAAGIFNRSYGATNRLMFIDSNYKIGSATGVAGAIPIAGGTGVVFNTITPGPGISVTNGVNSITIEATGSVDEIHTNIGVNVAPSAGILNIFGGSLTMTEGVAPNTVQVHLQGANTDGAIIIGKDGEFSEYGTLVSTDNTVQITPDVSTPGSFNINLSANGGAAGRGAFKGQLSGTVPNLTGDNTQYVLGNGGGLIMTELYDPANAYNPGDGISVPTSYTAPVNGVYHFELGLMFTNALVGFPEINNQQNRGGDYMEASFIVNGTPQYVNTNFGQTAVGPNAYGSIVQTSRVTLQYPFKFATDLLLNAGDIVTWSILTRNVVEWNTITANKVVGLTSGFNETHIYSGVGNPPINAYWAYGAPLNCTFVSGYIITPL